MLLHFGSISALFSAPPSAIAAVSSSKIAHALLAPPAPGLQALLKQSLTWAEAPRQHCIFPGHPAYPTLLQQIADPPLVLFVRGRLDLLQAPALAIVGSRHASQQGMRNAAAFAGNLSQAGLTIVSGLASGIDAAAHRAALTGSGSTIAVIGTGIDKVYPSQHRELSELIAGNGCIVSEYPLGCPAIAANFPRRNRLIAGLSRGVLVVEAAVQSGSLITAKVAAEQGREVFAIPGSIHSPMAKGCHALIKDGAKLVETAADILEELSFMYKSLENNAQPGADQHVLPQPSADLMRWLADDPVSLDGLVLQSNLDTARVMAELTELELNGQIEQLPGGFFRRLR